MLLYELGVKSNIMKSKNVLIVVIICMSLVFTAGCDVISGIFGGDKTDPDTSDQTPVASSEGEEESTAVEPKTIGIYADTADSYYSIINDTLSELAYQDPECDWTFYYKTGQGTADEQLKAVEDFIAADYDAVIVAQNNPNTTSACIEKCVTAGIPYFGAAYHFGGIANSGDSAGSVSYDYELSGLHAGQDALANGVSKAIIVEGILGMGPSIDRTEGFLRAYEEAGKSFGEKADGSKWTAEEVAIAKPSASDIKGDADIVVVSWKSGAWSEEKTNEVMIEAIELLGKDGWDGAYIQTNTMAKGAISVMEQQKLSVENYWIGSMNGSEESWAWAKDGLISFDENQPPGMEGALLYQMVKEYFKAGSVSRKHVHPYLTSYTKENIDSLSSSLIPFSDVDAFVAGVNAGNFTWKIDDPKFQEIMGY